MYQHNCNRDIFGIFLGQENGKICALAPHIVSIFLLCAKYKATSSVLSQLLAVSIDNWTASEEFKTDGIEDY